MRKLKLQMQITVDGFVADPRGELDWMTPSTDERLWAYMDQLIDTSDTILMGRKMTAGFVWYWEQVKPDNPEYTFAQKMVNTPKVVFSRTMTEIDGRNVRVENGPLVDAVNKLKRQAGKDILVYGGATFVRALLANRLLDELYLFVNPVALGQGMPIFGSRTPLKLTDSTAYQNGIVVNSYQPQ